MGHLYPCVKYEFNEDSTKIDLKLMYEWIYLLKEKYQFASSSSDYKTNPTNIYN
jgi:hypothetical protein